MKDKPDYTFFTVKRQLAAFGVDAYEVGIFDRAKATDPEAFAMQIKTYTDKEILNSLNLLKHKNLLGCDIFIRPLGSSPYVFFDDLTLGKIEDMTKQGLAPSILIESSPMNYHGWLKLSEAPIPEDLATACCQVLVKQFGADSGSADWRHFGRLGGFTNQKKIYVDDYGKQPFVKLSKAKPQICEKASLLLDQAKELLRQKALEQEKRVEQLAQIARTQKDEDAHAFFKARLLTLIQKYGNDLDHSKSDWMIANQMATTGFTQAQIFSALLALSPDLSLRKAGREEKYIQDTLDKIFGT